jgi:ribose/xylose/arabinose/galactoside ABC-type transport system permease subunit
MKVWLVLAGMLSLTVGCYWHYPPLAFMVLGGTLLLGGVGSHFYSARRRPK